MPGWSKRLLKRDKASTTEMIREKDQAKRKVQTTFFIIFLLSLILLLLPYWADAHSNFVANLIQNYRDFLRDVASSLFVATILVFTIEKITRERQRQAQDEFIDTVNKDVLRSVYKRYIPQAAFEEVEDTLLSARIERTNYIIDLNLLEIPEALEFPSHLKSNEYLLMRMHSSFTLKNLTNFPAEHEVTFTIEVPVEKCLSKHTQILNFKKDNKQLIKHDEGKVPYCQTSAACEFKTMISLAPRETANFHMDGQTIKRDVDSEVWASRICSDGITLKVSAPDNVVIDGKANHSKNLKPDPVPSGVNQKVFRLEHGILPFQSLIAWWDGSGRHNNPGSKVKED